MVYVYAVDIIGEAGFSAMERPGYEDRNYAKWLKDVITELGLQSVSIVGLSLGGWMALNLSTAYPELVDKLVLICPGGLARERLSFFVKFLFYSVAGNWGRRKMLALLNGGEELVPDSVGMKEAMDYTVMICEHFIPRTDQLPLYGMDELSVLSMPVLVVFGENDCLLDVPGSAANLKKCAPNARLDILKDTGHIIVDQSTRILEFLDSNK